ncbi:MAG: hypothetical protein P1V97_39115, partial [Planctomycetota bacterium]|nr:hypothetical protein [Planctomycetota bacterium]
MSRRYLIIFALLVFGLFIIGDPAFAQEAEGEAVKSVSWWTMYNYGGIVGYLLTILSFISLGL